MLGRVIAVLVMIASAGVIAWHHRDDLMPAPVAPIDPAEAAYQACVTERDAGIDKMQAPCSNPAPMPCAAVRPAGDPILGVQACLAACKQFYRYQ
jgi:hypothetical protein